METRAIKFLLLITCILSTGCKGKIIENETSSSGKETYRKFCSSCHTINGGTAEPTLTQMHQTWNPMKLKKKMKSFGNDSIHAQYSEILIEAQIDSIIYYIKNEFKPLGSIP